MPLIWLWAPVSLDLSKHSDHLIGGMDSPVQPKLGPLHQMHVFLSFVGDRHSSKLLWMAKTAHGCWAPIWVLNNSLILRPEFLALGLDTDRSQLVTTLARFSECSERFIHRRGCVTAHPSLAEPRAILAIPQLAFHTSGGSSPHVFTYCLNSVPTLLTGAKSN